MIPANATITGITMNIRDQTLKEGETATATVYTSPCAFAEPVSTNISVTVTGPSDPETPHCCASATGNVSVPACSLLFVKLTLSQGVGALAKGVSVTVSLKY